MRSRALPVVLLLSVVAAVGAAPAGAARAVEAPPDGQMHFPDVFGDRVVFTHGGDLWLGSLTGGAARRLTSHPGQEIFGRFSPDGTRIAFTGEYDGAWHVYVMPADGGEPTQLTWAPDMPGVGLRMGPNDMVVDWTPDGAGVLLLSRRNAFTPWFGQLFVVPVDGGLPERFPLPKGGLLAFEPAGARGPGSPAGKRVVYNRIFRNFRTWKRYQGGMAQDLWLYDFERQRSERLTTWVGTDTSPMWVGDAVYFASDRDDAARMNLWRHDLTTRQTVALTEFTDFDVLWPATDGRTIVFEKGGALYAVPLPATGRVEARRIPLSLPGDHPIARPRIASVAGDVRGFGLAPGGKRAVFAARGEVFTVPLEHGETRNLTRTPGADERSVAWSPDGRFVAYLSDASGEDEIWVAPAVPVATPDGDGATPGPRQVTHDGSIGRFQPEWSPDGKSFLVGNWRGELDLVDVAGGKARRVDASDRGEIRHYSWSPDARYVAYAKPGSPEGWYDIWLFDTEDGERHRVTESWTFDVAPLFGRDGKYLFFVSHRRLDPVLSAFDFSFAYTRTEGIYAIALRDDLPSPFEAPPDEAAVAGEGKKGEKGKKGGKGKKGDGKDGEEGAAPEPVRIDWEGIGGRVVDLPVPGMNLQYLETVPGGIVYLRRPTQGLGGPLAAEAPSLRFYDLEKRKDVALLDGVEAASVAPDGKHVIVQFGKGAGAAFKVAPLGADPLQPAALKPVDLSGLKTRVEPQTEWRAMFFQAWRYLRDRFYRSTMHGLDWAGLRDRYAALLPGVKSRFDLTLLLGELAGELSNSHTYVNRGDEPDRPSPRVGALGADLALDRASGRYRFQRILPGENWRADRVSPLTLPGVAVREGDYLLAVDGEQLRAPTNPSALLVGRAGVPTTLTVAARADGKDARFVRVTPIASENGLRYLDWVRTNRERVDRLSDGKVGYVYIPDMGRGGLDAFVEQWFPQVRKGGMVIDVRYNGGGFVDQLIFERLRRVVKMMALSRHGQPEPFLEEAFHGHLACVTNAYAASDGDLFSWFFKAYELGPLVGTRTWGGVRGIRGFLQLLDGGGVTVPEFSVYGMDSQWIMENRGVEPTVEVDDLPEDVLAGRDPQLETAVRLVLEKMRAEPRTLPPAPTDLPAYPPPGPSGPSL